MREIYYVTYEGDFGYIKPHNAVRDSVTYSEGFLTPSTVEGIRRYLGVNSIDRVKLSYNGLIDTFQVTQVPHNNSFNRFRSILNRFFLCNPKVILGFYNEFDATLAQKHTFALCVRECQVYPTHYYKSCNIEEFNAFPGSEFIECDEGDMYVGYNRYTEKDMIGTLEVVI